MEHQNNTLYKYPVKVNNHWFLISRLRNTGFVYVITHTELEKQNIYKIGSTKDINFMLKRFNEYKHSSYDPQFYIKLLFMTENEDELESKIYQKLINHRDEGDFFICELDVIKHQFFNKDCVEITQYDECESYIEENDEYDDDDSCEHEENDEENDENNCEETDEYNSDKEYYDNYEYYKNNYEEPYLDY